LRQHGLPRAPAVTAAAGQCPEDHHDGTAEHRHAIGEDVRDGSRQDVGEKCLGRHALRGEVRRVRGVGDVVEHIAEREVQQQPGADEYPHRRPLPQPQPLGSAAGDQCRPWPAYWLRRRAARGGRFRPGFGTHHTTSSVVAEFSVEVISKKTSSRDRSEKRTSYTAVSASISARTSSGARSAPTSTLTPSSSSCTASSLATCIDTARARSTGVARTNSDRPPRRSSTVLSVSRRPSEMTPTRSQISWTSLSRWLESKTVWPC